MFMMSMIGMIVMMSTCMVMLVSGVEGEGRKKRFSASLQKSLLAEKAVNVNVNLTETGLALKSHVLPKGQNGQQRAD
jgi:hypothetical protein